MPASVAGKQIDTALMEMIVTSLAWAARETNLYTLERIHGGALPAAAPTCGKGLCGVGEARVLSGQPDHRDAILSDAEPIETATMMSCCFGSKSDRLVLDL